MDWLIKMATIAKAAGPYVVPMLDLFQLALRSKQASVTEEDVLQEIKRIGAFVQTQREKEKQVWG